MFTFLGYLLFNVIKHKNKLFEQNVMIYVFNLYVYLERPSDLIVVNLELNKKLYFIFNNPILFKVIEKNTEIKIVKS